jgi:hypothetical protein
LRSSVAQVAALVKELDAAMSQLPHVDSQGYSSCPPDVVQELYDKKNKLEQQVADCIPTLTEILFVLEKEVQRCEQNLDRIRNDAGRIHSDETREKYSQAEQAQELELRRARDERDAVYMVLKKAELVLSVSRGRQMPPVRKTGGEGTPHRKDSGKDSSEAGSPAGHDPSSGGELDDLISLGPRGRH